MKVNITFDYDIERIFEDINDVELLVSKREFNKILREEFIKFIELEIEGIFATGEVPMIFEEKLINLNVIKE